MNCDGGYGGHQARDPKIEGMAGRAPAENTVEPPEAAAQMSSSTSWTSRAGAGSGLGPRVSGLGIGDDLVWIWEFMLRFGGSWRGDLGGK